MSDWHTPAKVTPLIDTPLLDTRFDAPPPDSWLDAPHPDRFAAPVNEPLTRPAGVSDAEWYRYLATYAPQRKGIGIDVYLTTCNNCGGDLNDMVWDGHSQCPACVVYKRFDFQPDQGAARRQCGDCGSETPPPWIKHGGHHLCPACLGRYILEQQRTGRRPDAPNPYLSRIPDDAPIALSVWEDNGAGDTAVAVQDRIHTVKMQAAAAAEARRQYEAEVDRIREYQAEVARANAVNRFRYQTMGW